ncbi:SH3 domain-containing protein, partial [Methylophaga pinxianii]
TGINSALALANLTQTSISDKAIESINSQKTGINSALALANLTQTSIFDKAIESISSQKIGINNALALANLTQTSTFRKAIESINSQQMGINSALGSIANFLEMDDMLSSFASSSARILNDHSALSTIFASMERADFSSFNFENIENELTTAANEFKKAENVSSLATKFTALPPLFQAIFFYILFHVLQPILTNISANLLTPVVESYLQDNNLADREKVKQIKEIPLYINDVNTEGLRFITANNVRLRSKPSTKSEILDELVLGQIVTILSKDRNWIEVTYTYGDGEVMSGWVFTRYTAKFVR